MSNMVVYTNIMALNSHRSLKGVGTQQSKASARLSSGMRVNSAADDAAGLAISEKMRAQIRGLDMASKNAQDAISLVQTAEGGLQEVGNMVQRIRELLVQGSNDTNESTDLKKIAAEIKQLGEEVGKMTDRVQFNNKTLLTGIASLTFQVGANSNQTTVTTVLAGNSITAIGTAYNQFSASGVNTGAISGAQAHLDSINQMRADLGALQNRLEYSIKSLDTSSENLSASESRIRDTDMAKEMMNLTKSNVLQQAATSMLAQANQAPQSVLQLLQG